MIYHNRYSAATHDVSCWIQFWDNTMDKSLGISWNGLSCCRPDVERTPSANGARGSCITGILEEFSPRQVCPGEKLLVALEREVQTGLDIMVARSLAIVVESVFHESSDSGDGIGPLCIGTKSVVPAKI